jgi:hypothetical protein
LHIGEDEGLLHTRSAVLSSAGFKTVDCVVADFNDCHPEEPFRVAVLCHSIARAKRRGLSEAIRARWPAIRVLQMDKLFVFASDNGEHADMTITAGEPWSVISAVRQLLSDTASGG